MVQNSCFPLKDIEQRKERKREKKIKLENKISFTARVKASSSRIRG